MTYSERVIADGASNYWRLNETAGLTAVDSIGGKHGTISGGVTLNQSGVDGTTAMVFNGTSGRIVVPSADTVLAFGSGPCTIECWLRTTNLGNQWFFDGKQDGVAGCPGMGAYTNGGELVGAIGNGTTVNYLNVLGTLADGQWHHCVFTFARGATDTQAIYVNGQLINSGPFGSGANITPLAGTQLFMGSRFGPADFFSGALQDIAIYPRALTPAEITAHYKSRVTLTQYQSRVLADGASAYWPLDEVAGTVARDLTAGAKHGTISGGVTLNQPGAGGGTAMTFNGTTGKIVGPSLALTLQATVETWIKTTPNAENRPLLTLGTGQQFVDAMGSPGRFTIGSQPNGLGVDSPGFPLLVNGAWHQHVVVLDGAAVRCYIDGAMVFTTAFVRTVVETGILGLGHDPAFGAASVLGFWNGSLQDIAIYPRALTPAEIATHYQTRLVPPVTSTDLTTAFAGYLKTLRAANPGKDLTTLVMKDLPRVRAAAPDELDDINTMYDDYLGGD